MSALENALKSMSHKITPFSEVAEWTFAQLVPYCCVDCETTGEHHSGNKKPKCDNCGSAKLEIDDETAIAGGII